MGYGLGRPPHPTRGALGSQEASPGHYAVDLATWGIHVEATATARATMYRLRFPKGRPASLVFDVGHALTAVVGAWVGVRGKGEAPIEVEGFSRSGNFCGSGQKQTVYFFVRVDRASGGTPAWDAGPRTAP